VKAVDTTFLIDLLRGDDEAVAMAEKLDEEGAVATTVVNVFELVYGIYASRGGARKRRMAQAEALFNRLEVFPLDYKGALTAAHILGELARLGKTVNVLDGLIAGILLANRCETIVTRNVRDFSRISGLRIETY